MTRPTPSHAKTGTTSPRAPSGDRDYLAGTGTTSPRAGTGTTSKYGLYSHNFTPEEIAWLDTMSTDQWLADLKRRMRMMTADLLRRPDLSDRERRRILAALKRLDLP
ncbi:MAG: hypothetical protein NTW99_05505 [Chloroflexi bacterium]|nr:hypothetical protein [Chloroflexota bacterium]